MANSNSASALSVSNLEAKIIYDAVERLRLLEVEGPEAFPYKLRHKGKRADN